MRKYAIAAAAALSLVVPATAGAHITLQPKEAPAEAFVKLDVRVPNEKDNASTTKVDVQFPPGFAFASYEPVPGWTAKITREKAAKPIVSHGEEITEQISRITWTGGKIGPGQFVDFPISVQVPGKAGDTLTFKALQTYSDGDVVRWIGAPDSEKPAPQVQVTAPADSHGAAAAKDDDAKADDGDDSDDGDSKGIAIAALALAAVALVTGGAALLRSRSGN